MISFMLKMDDEFVRLSMRVAGDRGVRQSHSHTIIYSPKMADILNLAFLMQEQYLKCFATLTVYLIL